MDERILYELSSLKKEIENNPMSFEAITQQAEVRDAIADSVAAIVVVLESRKILGSTTLADETFGYMEGELTDKDVNELLPERFRASHTEYLKEFSLHPSKRQMGKHGVGGDKGARNKLMGIKRDGVEFPVEVSLRPKVVSGKRCAVAVIFDMTGRNE